MIQNAESILVIIVCSVLVLFLLLAIVTTIYVIRTVKLAKQVIGKAEDVVDSAEAVTEALRNASGPLAAAKVVGNLMKIARKARKGKK